MNEREELACIVPTSDAVALFTARKSLPPEPRRWATEAIAHCDECNHPFIPTRPWQKFHCPKCKKANKQRRDRARMREVRRARRITLLPQNDALAPEPKPPAAWRKPSWLKTTQF